MATAQHIDYSRSIKKVKSIVHQDLKLKKNTCDLINQMLNSLNRQILSCVPPGGIGLEPLRSAVEDLLVGDSRRHAIVEGNRCVLNYGSGLVDFRPAVVKRQQARERETRRRARRQRGAELGGGLARLAQTAGAAVQRKAGQLLCQVLEDLMRCIARTARESALERECAELTAEDVAESVRRWLTENLCAHALAEGSRQLALMDNGRLVFKPRTKRKSAPVSTSRERKKARKTTGKRKTRASTRRRKKAASEVGDAPAPAPSAKRPRRSRARRKKTADEVSDEPEAAAEVSDEPEAAAEVSDEPETAAEVSDAPAPAGRRARTRRKRKADEISDEPDAPAAKKPRRQRTPRRKKAAKKSRRKRTPRRKTTDAEDSDESDTVASRRPKRKRTPRRKKADAEVSDESDTAAAKKPRRKRTPRRKKAAKKSRRKRTPRRKTTDAEARDEPDGAAAKKTPRRKQAASEKKPKSKRAPRTTAKALEPGINKFCKNKTVTLDKAARERAAAYVERVLVKMLDEMTRAGSGRVGAQEVREAVLRVFPEEYVATALANLSRLVALMQVDRAQ